MTDDHKDAKTGNTAIPLIVGVLAALTIGYWLFQGGSNSERTVSSTPAAAPR
jgi:hypothetical protein